MRLQQGGLILFLPLYQPEGTHAFWSSDLSEIATSPTADSTAIAGYLALTYQFNCSSTVHIELFLPNPDYGHSSFGLLELITECTPIQKIVLA